MKILARILAVACGLLVLGLPVLRAADAGEGKLGKTREKYDADKDGKLSREERAQAKEAEAAKTKVAQAEAQKAALAKYDADHNGRLDENEQAKLKSDEEKIHAVQSAKLRQALAKYDANHNGQIDKEELARMKEDEVIAARAARQEAQQDARMANKMQRLTGGTLKGRKR